MADDKDKDQDEPLHSKDEGAEYQPAEEEYAEEEPEKKPRGAIFKKLLKNRKLWLVVGVIIAVGIVYQFVKTPKGREEIQAMKTGLQPRTQATPTLAGTTPAAPSVSPTQTPTLATVAGGEGQQQVMSPTGPTGVGGVSTGGGGVLTGQNQQIQQLQIALQQLQATMQQYGNQMARCNAVTNITQPVSPPIISAAPAVITKVVSKAAPRLTYHVRAIVPHRAWLLANNGHLTTVKVGDFLPGYGRVVSINPASGRVRTSWKSVITYGRNDS